MPRQFGPNDFHMDHGVITPGLGPDEPSDLTKEQMLADAKSNAARAALLEQNAAELAQREVFADGRQVELDEREAELAARERRLRELEAELSALTNPATT